MSGRLHLFNRDRGAVIFLRALSPEPRSRGGLDLPVSPETPELEVMPLADRLLLSFGAGGEVTYAPTVNDGERVFKGQLLARANAGRGAALHAPTSGVVRADAGRRGLILEVDGADEAYSRCSGPTGDALERVRDAGVVGMGGGGFPAAQKIEAASAAEVHTVVVNGVECEPDIQCDDALMRSRPREVVAGARLLRELSGARRAVIAVQDDMLKAASELSKHVAGDVEIVRIERRYPAGDERLLTTAITGQEVVSGELPLSVGVLMQNVATAASVSRAVEHGEPSISRIVTVTGGALPRPRNLEVRIGTSVSDLLAFCGVDETSLAGVVLGGRLTGELIGRDDAAVGKTTHCIVAAAPGELRADQPRPCIRCGDCVPVCPVGLLPQQLYYYASAKDSDHAAANHALDCIECGACSYVCPSRIPLLQHFRRAKGEILAASVATARAEVARSRFEARERRLTEEARCAAEDRSRQRRALEAAAKTSAGSAAAITQATLREARNRARSRRESPPT